MTGEQILRGMTIIDEVFILEAAPRTEQKQRRSARGWLGYAAAACLCLVMTGSILWQVVKPMPVAAFEIEDGVLLAYHGTDTEVVIPDEVTKISASAFAAAPSPDSITSVTLGTNVEIIDPLTFAETKNLDTITVPEENKNFYCREGVLLAADGSLAIDTARAYEESMDIFVDVISDMTDGRNIFGDTVSFVFGKAKITVSVEENPKYATGEDSRAFHCYITAIEFDEARLVLEESEPLVANHTWDIVQADDMLIYFLGNKGFGDTYLLVDGKVVDISNVGISEPNDTVISYGQDESGNITYTRKPYKYIMVGGWWEPLKYSTGRDELCQEDGIVTWNGNKLVYTPTATFSVEERINLDLQFEGYISHINWMLDNGVTEEQLIESGYCPNCETIEDLFEFNKSKYESWK